MRRLFISHSSHDDGFVRGIQQALGNFKQEVWIDSRDRPGSRHAPAGPALGTSARRRRLPFPGREAYASASALAKYARARRTGVHYPDPQLRPTASKVAPSQTSISASWAPPCNMSQLRSAASNFAGVIFFVVFVIVLTTHRRDFLTVKEFP